MTDNAGNKIGYTQRMGEGLYPFSDSNPLQFQSKLEEVLTCKPEQQYDYIAFALGQQAWPSNGDFKANFSNLSPLPPLFPFEENLFRGCGVWMLILEFVDSQYRMLFRFWVGRRKVF